ncbi:Acetoacetyl-CoA synthetase [Paramyrothecium foliicola]|nr:Acetoacetyl-CoA synthetase [Paramyrothecium foliicola]
MKVPKTGEDGARHVGLERASWGTEGRGSGKDDQEPIARTDLPAVGRTPLSDADSKSIAAFQSELLSSEPPSRFAMEDLTKAPRKLWEPSNPQNTRMWKFMEECNRRHGLKLKNFDELYTWTCENRSLFWNLMWEWADIIHEGSYSKVVDETVPVSELPRWFEGVRVNYAENILWSRGRGDAPGTRSTRGKEDDAIAVTEVREGNTSIKHITWRQLRAEASKLASALQARGVGKGDRVVVVGAHSLQTLVVFLATSWLGGVFSSSSTDMGIGGLLQRTVQIDPKFIFFDDGAIYNGRTLDLRDKIAGVVEGMRTCKSFEKAVIIQRFDKPNDTSKIPKTERLQDFLASAKDVPVPPIVRVEFQDPLIVYYSSGTTGIPKAIVHGVGPLLISSRKESYLHRNMDGSNVGLQFTTTGWIMWLASIAPLQIGGRVVVYDGSPFIPDLKVLLRIVEQQKVTQLGISPRWMGELMKNRIAPREVADLSTLRSVISTGMVLPDQLFEWFYDVAFPKHVQLANITGGTDIAGCFGIENPISPLYVGGCQGGGLGVPIAVFDHDLPDGSDGKPLPHGSAGDLVATAAFPNVPLFLWGDKQPAPGEKYHGAYFARYNKVWAQGDFCAIHPVTKSLVMLGRSDGVLNPSGVRFGSSDIYAVLERCFAELVAESLCVGQRRPQDLDERVVLFLLMKNGKKLDRALVKQVKDTIARELTKRHVPKYIFEVPEIPVTVNLKKVELPVKHIISGKNIKPSGTLLNPQSLQFFYQFQKIEDLVEPQAKL